jgi:uncharacterized protein DUF3108
MEKNKVKSIVGTLLTIIILSACSAPSQPSPIETQVIETQAPAATPTEIATEPPATSEAVTPATPGGLCANAYYPVHEGATWSYKSTGGPTGEYSFTDTITSVRADGFTLSSQFGDLTRTQEWACKPEGLVALQLGGTSAATLNSENMQLNLEVKNVNGVTYPSEINVGDQWQHYLDFEGKMTVANQEGTATGNAQTNFNSLGNERVTVPAGTFDALKIQIDTTLNINVSVQGIAVPVKFSGSYTYWFVKDVGWVKASGTGSVSGTSFNETIELQLYNIP